MIVTNQTFQKLLTVWVAAVFTIGIAACGSGSKSGDNSGENKQEKEMKKSDSKQSDKSGEKGDQGKTEKSSNDKPMTIQEFANAAKAHIMKKAKKSGGHFMVKDQKTGKKLKLNLEKVHRKRLSHLGNNRYFVCANFTSQDGTLYDVDIFMEGTKKSNLEEAGKPKVHKVEGEPRFNYYKEDGVWKRRSVDQKQDKS